MHTLKQLAVISFIILTTLVNVFICITIAQFAMIQLMYLGIEKYIALFTSLVLVILIQLYLIYYSKIRDYIKNGSF